MENWHISSKKIERYFPELSISPYRANAAVRDCPAPEKAGQNYNILSLDPPANKSSLSDATCISDQRSQQHNSDLARKALPPLPKEALVRHGPGPAYVQSCTKETIARHSIKSRQPPPERRYIPDREPPPTPKQRPWSEGSGQPQALSFLGSKDQGRTVSRSDREKPALSVMRSLQSLNRSLPRSVQLSRLSGDHTRPKKHRTPSSPRGLLSSSHPSGETSTARQVSWPIVGHPALRTSAPMKSFSREKSVEVFELDNQCVHRGWSQICQIKVMMAVDSFPDLFNLRLLNREWNQSFEKCGLAILKSVLWNMSPPAWECLEMSENHDNWASWWDEYRSAVQVVSFTSAVCIRAAGNCHHSINQYDSLDAACWRIWTFCKIFGNDKQREEEIDAQVDWLRGNVHFNTTTPMAACSNGPLSCCAIIEPPKGFAQGNIGGLTDNDLNHMLNIWDYLLNLQLPQQSVILHDQGHWFHYILTLGLSETLSCLRPVNLDTFAPEERLWLETFGTQYNQQKRLTEIKERFYARANQYDADYSGFFRKATAWMGLPTSLGS